MNPQRIMDEPQLPRERDGPLVGEQEGDLPISLSEEPFVPDDAIEIIDTSFGILRRGLRTPEDVIRHKIDVFALGNNPEPILLGRIGDTPCYLRLSDGLAPSQVDFKLYPATDTHYYSVRRNGFNYDLFRHEYRMPSHDEVVEWVNVLIETIDTSNCVEIPACGYRIYKGYLSRSRAEVDFIHNTAKHGNFRVQGGIDRSFFVLRV